MHVLSTTLYLLGINFLQILMNVLHIMVGVNKDVSMIMALTTVNVNLVINSLVMVEVAQVCNFIVKDLHAFSILCILTLHILRCHFFMFRC